MNFDLLLFALDSTQIVISVPVLLAMPFAHPTPTLALSEDAAKINLLTPWIVF